MRRNALDFLALTTIVSIANNKGRKHRCQISNAHAIDSVSRTDQHKTIRRAVRRSSGVYVRYRYDAEQRRRYKPVELIVEKAVWQRQPGNRSNGLVRLGSRPNIQM